MISRHHRREIAISHSLTCIFDQLFMSTLANETIFETLFEETLEELDVRNYGLLFSQHDIENIAREIAMDKFLSNNP